MKTKAFVCVGAAFLFQLFYPHASAEPGLPPFEALKKEVGVLQVQVKNMDTSIKTLLDTTAKALEEHAEIGKKLDAQQTILGDLKSSTQNKLFWKVGNNGCATCESFCKNIPQYWGPVGECILAERINAVSDLRSCSAHQAPCPGSDVRCLCMRP